MKTKTQKPTTKILFTTLMANAMCMSVVLSHVHAKDAVSLLHSPGRAQNYSTNDITAKALGDLHHHIDKASVKNIHMDSTTNTIRARNLKPLEAIEDIEESILAKLQNMFVRAHLAVMLGMQRF